MLLVVAHSRDARASLRHACARHEDSVVRRFGRATLLEETAFGVFLALRLRAKHPGAVQVERTGPLLPGAVPDDVRRAVDAYADRDHASTPYAAFAAGTDHPVPAALKDREL